MGIPLDKFISNLENIRDTGLVKICEQEIKDIFFQVLYEMASLTIIDTGAARSTIIEDFARKHGYPYEDLFIEYYDFWKNDAHGNRESDVNYSDKFDKRKARVEIVINDEGLYAQENAINGKFKNTVEEDGEIVEKIFNYPSTLHSEGDEARDIVGTGRDNSRFATNHITLVSDSWMANPEIMMLFKVITKHYATSVFYSSSQRMDSKQRHPLVWVI